MLVFAEGVKARDEFHRISGNGWNRSTPARRIVAPAVGFVVDEAEIDRKARRPASRASLSTS